MLAKQKGRKIKQNRWRFFLRHLAIFLGITSGFFLFSSLAQAATIDFTDNSAIEQGAILTGEFIVSGILSIITSVLDGILSFLGLLLPVLVKIFATVATYGQGNEFASQPEVIIGWQIIRDTINAFYIVILIVIAMATIFRWQPWEFRKTLPKLILSAILINFSRLICLLAINFSTSIMATFTKSIQTGIPAFLLGLRIPALTATDTASLNGLFSNLVTSTEETATNAALGVVQNQFGKISGMIALMVGIWFLGMVIVMMAGYVMLLVIRIIMLWLLMILSPLAFFLWGIPGGKASGYWSEWISEFIKYTLAGPLIVFFVYLDIIFFINNTSRNYGIKIPDKDLPDALQTLIGKPNILIGYMVGMALLMMGLEITQKLSLRGGNFVANNFNPANLRGSYFGRAASGAFSGARAGLGATINNPLTRGIQNRAYRRYAGRIPLAGALIKPGKAYENFKQQLAQKEQSIIDQGEENAKLAAARAGGAGNRASQALYALGAGSKSQYIKEVGLGGLVGALTVGAADTINQVTPGGGSSVRLLENQALNQELKAINAKKKFVDTSKDEPAFDAIKGLNRSQIQEGLAIAQRQEDLANDENVTEAQRAAVLEELRAQYQSLGVENAEELFTGEQEAIKAMDESLAEAGVLGNDTTTLEAHQAAFGKSLKQDEKRKATVEGELRTRAQSANYHGASSSAVNFEKVKKESREMYAKGKQYSVEDFVTDMESAMADKKPERYMAAVAKATESGKLQDVYSELGLDYSQAGIEAVNKFNMEKGGLSKEQSAELIEHSDQINAAAGRHGMAHMAKRTRYGGVEVLSGESGKTQHIEAAAKAFAKDFKKALTGKAEGVLTPAGEITEALKKAIKENPRRFGLVLSNTSPDNLDPKIVEKLKSEIENDLQTSIESLPEGRERDRAQAYWS